MMNTSPPRPRWRRRLFVGLLLLLTLALGTLLALWYSAGGPIAALVIREGAAAGARITVKSAATFLPGVRLSGLEIFFPRALLGLVIDSAEATVTGFSVSTPAVDYTVRAYQGTISGQVKLGSEYPWHKAEFVAAGRALEPAFHPLLLGFGITAGTIGFDLRGALANGVWTGSTRLVADALQKPRPSTLAPAVTGAPVPITIPPIRDLDALIEASFTPTSISAGDLRLSSSLGTFRGRGEASLLAGGNLGEWRCEGVVHLHEAGGEFLGPWLPVISGGSLDASTRVFRLTGSGRGGRSTVRLTRAR